MANIIPANASRSGAVVNAAGNTASGGDEVVYSGGGLLLMFENGHTADITVSIAPTATSVSSAAGPVTPPTRTLVVPANGGRGQILFDEQNVTPYFNANKRIPLAYTGHNAALKVNAVALP